MYPIADDDDARSKLYHEIIDGEGDRAAVPEKSKVLEAHSAYLQSLCSNLDFWRDADSESAELTSASGTAKKKNDPEKLRAVVHLCDTIIGFVTLEKILAWFGSKNTDMQPDYAKQKSYAKILKLRKKVEFHVFLAVLKRPQVIETTAFPKIDYALMKAKKLAKIHFVQYLNLTNYF